MVYVVYCIPPTKEKCDELYKNKEIIILGIVPSFLFLFFPVYFFWCTHKKMGNSASNCMPFFNTPEKRKQTDLPRSQSMSRNLVWVPLHY